MSQGVSRGRRKEELFTDGEGIRQVGQGENCPGTRRRAGSGRELAKAGESRGCAGGQKLIACAPDPHSSGRPPKTLRSDIVFSPLSPAPSSAQDPDRAAESGAADGPALVAAAVRAPPAARAAETISLPVFD